GDRFTISIDLKLGSKGATIHTCDLSTDYIRINSHYRT
ncbi:MAG: bifunctional ornithine acetyltransferase/N-acetylglutamate synthase, partial [Deltaproteobacteria bacterium]|nr:bifunctional ornithine acetyltransferase/N-acetylglutamate synthase [Deltaproteobacteria bacterium]